MALQHRLRHPGAPDRSSNGPIIRRIPARAHLRSARNERHWLLLFQYEKIDRLPASYGFNHRNDNVLMIFDDQRGQFAGDPIRRLNRAQEVLYRPLTITTPSSVCCSNKGRYEDRQIISRASVELMTSDQLTSEQRAGAGPFFGDFSSWGFGVAVDTRRADLSLAPADLAGQAALAPPRTLIRRSR